MNDEQQYSKRKRIERQIENILVAQAMMADVPDENIVPKLRRWSTMNSDDIFGGRSPSTRELRELKCGAAACFGGWVAVHPHFRKQGVKRDSITGGPYTSAEESDEEVAMQLFGPAARQAFYTAGGSNHDREGATERECIDARLNAALRERLYALEQFA